MEYRTCLTHPVRVGVFGAGSFANKTHLPNLRSLDGVEIVAISDVYPEARRSTAETFGIPRTYADAHEMIASEQLDALYSIVPAFIRTDVEATAASKGIHIFSEKPQALTMAVARRIDTAIREAGVLSTVGFRERYRPLFQEAKRLLQDKKIAHVSFFNIGGLPEPPPPEHAHLWNYDMQRGGVDFFDWGVHATDYTRFIIGQNVVRAQAFLNHPAPHRIPVASSFHYQFSLGATMTMTFIDADPSPHRLPWFTVFFEGGRLELYRYDRIEVNGDVVYHADEFDPWLEQDRVFIEAVRAGDGSRLQSDYHDGLFSLGPVLAGWESARRNGECIDVAAFMEA